MVDETEVSAEAEVAEVAEVAVEESSEPVSLRDAIEGAFDKVEKSDTASERPRDDKGQFAKAEGDEPVADEPEPAAEAEETPAEPAEAEETQSPLSEAPSRFSPDAKEAWKDAPESVKGEISRAVKELEGGIEQYRNGYEPFKAFDEMVRANNQDPANVLNQYTSIERELMQNPMQGLETICSNLGTSLREVAATVLNQPPPPAAAQDGVINSLKQEIAQLKQEVGGVSSTIAQQNDRAIQSELASFEKDHPRMNELRGDMALFLESGRAKDMQEAYDMAERLNPASNPAPPAIPAETQPAPAQTRKGKLSVTGAPASGSNPNNRKPSTSTREALKRSFAQTGLA
jgi:hypothetical protein